MKYYAFQAIKSNLQALSDETIPLELAIKPLTTYDEGRTVMQELSSTQTMITSLISNDNDQLQNEKIKELKTYVEKSEQFLVELKNNEEKFVSLLMLILHLILYLFMLFCFRMHMMYILKLTIQKKCQSNTQFMKKLTNSKV